MSGRKKDNIISGTKTGGKKVVETRVQKYIDQGYSEIEARKMVSDDYRRIGAKGGSVKGTKCGFASNVIGNDGLTGFERARVAGALGGAKSRRVKKNG